MFMRAIGLGIVAVLVTGAASVASLRVGQEWGRAMLLNEMTYAGAREQSAFDRMSRLEKAIVAARSVGDRGIYHAPYQQDRWIAAVVYPEVRDGFYVDVGAADGTRQSNSRVLDDLGWTGLAIDPFPTNMDSRRRTTVLREVVASTPGQVVTFRASAFAGGIEQLLGSTKGWAVHESARAEQWTTTTLDAILARTQAPSFIHYMSLDIEGAEYEALKGLSLDRYRVGAFTIEHNWEEPKRSQIRALLESHGYRNVFALIRDDFYIHTSLLGGQTFREPQER